MSDLIRTKRPSPLLLQMRSVSGSKEEEDSRVSDTEPHFYNILKWGHSVVDLLKVVVVV